MPPQVRARPPEQGRPGARRKPRPRSWYDTHARGSGRFLRPRLRAGGFGRGPGHGPGAGRPSHLQQGRRAHPLQALHELPSTRGDRADVVHDLRDDAAVGAGHPAQGRGARDATLGRRSRQQHEDAERPHAVAEGDRHAGRLGGRGAPRGDAADLPPAPTYAWAGSAASPTTSSRCRSTGRSRPTAPSRISTSTSRFPSPRTSGPPPSRSGPATSPSSTTLVPMSWTSPRHTVKGGYLYDKDGKQVPPTEPMGTSATTGDERPIAGANKLIRRARARHRGASRRLRQAHPGRQVHPLGDALQPDGQGGVGSEPPRPVVGQGHGDPRGAQPAGGRPGAGQRQPRPLLRAGQGSALQLRRHDGPPRQDADHSALRGQLQDDGHHARQRADHALRADAAHAPARQEHEVVGDLSRRPRRGDSRRAELRLQLAGTVRAGRAAQDSGRQQDHQRRHLRQLGEEQVEPGAAPRGLLVGAELGRDVPADDAVLGGQPGPDEAAEAADSEASPRVRQQQ